MKTFRNNMSVLKNVVKFLEDKGILYHVPYSLPMREWSAWRAKTMKEFPIQYHLREWASTLSYRLKHRWRVLRSYVKYTVSPPHKLVRKALPRREWTDLSTLIPDINFAIIRQFKIEADKSFVDWTATDDHKKFKNWLDTTNDWIVNGRPSLLKQIDDAYPPIGSLGDLDNLFDADTDETPEEAKVSYDRMYGAVNQLTALLDTTDTNILKGLIDHREYFWT